MTEYLSIFEAIGSGRYKAIAFDAFGTLVHIPGYRKPYRQLVNYLKSQGLALESADSDRLMTNPVELSAVGTFFGYPIPSELLQLAEMDLHYDLNAITLFDDTLKAVKHLQEQRMKIGLCSNLAVPYGAPVKALLPDLDVYAWSYEIGAVKPDVKIYDYLCRKLRCLPEEVLMIGDTLETDYFGPRRFGMASLHISRQLESKAPHYISSLNALFF